MTLSSPVRPVSETDEPLTVADALVDSLVGWNVEAIFCVSGANIVRVGADGRCQGALQETAEGTFISLGTEKVSILTTQAHAPGERYMCLGCNARPPLVSQRQAAATVAVGCDAC